MLRNKNLRLLLAFSKIHLLVKAFIIVKNKAHVFFVFFYHVGGSRYTAESHELC